MTDETKLRNKLFKALAKLSKIANGLKIAAIPLLILNIIVSLIGFYYFFQQGHLGHWRWGVPTLIMTLPLASVVVVIWVLDSVTSVPEAVKNASGEFLTIVKHHRKKLDLIENHKISKIKYLKTIGKILWEATDVIDGIGMAAFIATPVFWFIYAGAFLGTFIFGGIMTLTILIHYYFL